MAGKMPPKEKKTPEGEERKKRKKSSKGKEQATVIRDEPERNLFLESLQSINQPPTATDPPERRRSARHSQSTISHSTPSPSTRAASPKSTKQSTNDSTNLKHVQQPGGSGRFTIHTTLKDGKNVNFQEWLDELAAGHTSHAKYID